MKLLVSLVLLLCSLYCHGQSFAFASKDAVQVPAPIATQIRAYIEKHDGVNMKTFGNNYAYVPTFNVLNRLQKQFVDGIYYFSWGAHDSGRLFVNNKGIITILRNDNTKSILEDYISFINRVNIPQNTQLTYLSAITNFMKFRLKDQEMLVKSGALHEAK